MILSFLSDIKNFTFGAISGGLNGASRWGGWAFGYHGDSHNKQGQFGHFRLGGLLLPTLVIAILAAPFSLAAPAMALGAYAAGVVGLAALGGTIGALTSGFSELREGILARREWQDQIAQQRDFDKISQIKDKLHDLDGQKAKQMQKIEQTQARMEKRRERGGHVDALLQERAAAARGKGK